MADQEKVVTNDVEEKMLGAFVPKDLFWQFKETAAGRKEKMCEAIAHAAYLYIAVEEKGDSSNGRK
jgi:hypothetical protein